MMMKKLKRVCSIFLVIAYMFFTSYMVYGNDSLETEVGVGFYGEWIWDEEPPSETSPTPPPETSPTQPPTSPTSPPETKPTPPPDQRPPIRLPQTGAMVAMGGSIAIILLLSAWLLLRKKKREAQKTTEL